MDSINKNQPEKNREDLQGKSAITKIKEIANEAKTCFFCTVTGNSDTDSVRPMTHQKIDEDGIFWFLSSSDSLKNFQIQENNKVRLLYQGSAHSDFLSIEGTASISQDKSKIKELWQPILKTWFTEGENDQRITVIKVIPEAGYYWDNKHGNMIAGIKMMIGAAIGKTLDDSIEGKLNR